MAWSELLSDAEPAAGSRSRPMKEDGSPMTDPQKNYLHAMAQDLIRFAPAEDPDLDLDVLGTDLVIALDSGAMTKAQASRVISVLKPFHLTLRSSHTKAPLLRRTTKYKDRS